MRKSMKKIMSVVTAAAMALAMIAVPSTEALAVDAYYVVGNDAITQEGKSAWTPGDAAAMTDNGDGTYSYTFDTTASTTYEFQILPSNTGWDGQIGLAAGGNFAALALEAGSATITFDPSQSGDDRVSWTGLVEPNPAEEYYVVGDMNSWTMPGAKMTANDDGTYTAVFEQIAGGKYEFKVAQDTPTYGWYASWGDGAGNASNAEGLNWDYETLTVTFNPTDNTITSTAVEAEAPELPSEEQSTEPEDPDATTLTVHVKTNWIKPKFYAFMTDDTTVQLTGGWPGAAMTANADNEGYYSAKVTLDAAAGVTFIINGTDADTNSVQTVNIPVEIADGANEVWVTIGDLATEADEFGNTNYTATTATEAPEGWVASEIGEIETPSASEDESTDGNEDPTEDEGNAAWDSAKLKIHFLNSEEWEKVGVYLTYGSWAEITGKWPGAEMQLEVNSETWYAIGTNADAEDLYNVIFNNMVSDEEAAEGAVKHQTVDTKELAAGEYWFVLDEVTKEAEDQITYSVKQFTSVEELEAAGYTYDGEGLAGDLAEDPSDETTASEGDGKTDPAETGDVLPVAVVMLGVAAAVAVVASRKRNNA